MGIDARMFVRIAGRERWLDEDAVAGLAHRLATTIGGKHFHIDAEGRALAILPPFQGRVVWEQDGPPIVAGAEEQFVEVRLCTRFFEEGYPRGDWAVIRAVAEWLERHLPGEVWYGGDSAGVLAEPFPQARRRRLNDYYLTLADGQGGAAAEAAMAAQGFRKIEGPACRTCGVPLYLYALAAHPPEEWRFECSACGVVAFLNTRTRAVRWV